MKRCLRVIIAIAVMTALTSTSLCAASLVVHHPDFQCRLGVKLYVQVGDVAKDVTLKAVLTSDKGMDEGLVHRAGPLSAEEVLTCDFRKLPAATYTLRISLSDGRKTARTWKKPHDGIPRVGIDQNNAVCIDGKPFFPVAPWFIADEKEIKAWDKQINTLNGVGFKRSGYSIAGCRAFLDLARKHNKMAIVPGRGSYWPNGGKDTGTCYYSDADGKKQKDRKADHAKMAEYVTALKDHPALLLWHWKDEPELDNAKNCIPPAEVRKWAEITRAGDPQHPVFLNTGGGKFGRPVGNWGYKHIKTYTFHHNGIQGPRKVLLADVISQDYYPIENRNDSNYEISIENMCLSMDRMREWNHNLAPLMSCVETCDIRKKDAGPPTPTELRLLCWANIIHGARGIVWFHHFNPTPPQNMAEMARFVEQVTRLTAAVCGPKYTGMITKAEAKGGRVDFMATTVGADLYIIAANLKRQAETLTFALDVSPKKIEVVDERRGIKAQGKTFTDHFGPLAVHIYRVSK